MISVLNEKQLFMLGRAVQKRDFEKNGGYDMINYSFPDSTSDKAKSLIEQLEEVDKQYKIKLNKDVTENDIKPDFEKMEYKPKTTEQVMGEASDALSGYKAESISDIDNDYKNQLNKENELYEEKRENARAEQENVGKKFDQLKEDAQNDAIKKGVAKSSILINNIKAFDDAKLAEYEKINTDIAQMTEKFNSTKTLLETQKQTALSNFDIAYAVKLTDKINSINEQLTKQEQAVLKYNNEIALKEAEYELKQINQNINEEKSVLQQNEFLKDFIDDYGVAGLNKIKEEEKLEVAKSYLSNMDKDSAINEVLSNKSYKKLMGSYYSELLKYLDGRK